MDDEKKRNFLFNSHIMNVKFTIAEKVHRTASLKDIRLSAKYDKGIALEEDDSLFDENGEYDVYELTAYQMKQCPFVPKEVEAKVLPTEEKVEDGLFESNLGAGPGAESK